MKRLVAACSALVLVALVSAGCNTLASAASAASVDSLGISTSQLDASLSGVQADRDFLCLSNGGTQPVTSGVGTGTWSTTFADFVLAQLIKFRVLDEMVAAHHLVAPAANLPLAALETEEHLAETLETLPEGACPGTPASMLEGLGASFRAALVRNQLNIDVYSAYLAGTNLRTSALARWELAHPAATTESCTSVIGVSSHALAVRIERAVRSGASFAAEAERYSQAGGGQGGAVGCVLESQWNDGFGPIVAALKVGAVSGPVKYESGWLLFYVTKRQPEPVTAVVSTIDGLEQAAFDTGYARALGAARISVAAEYGSLERTRSAEGISLEIVPPGRVACSYALSPARAGCPPATTVAPGGLPTGSPPGS